MKKELLQMLQANTEITEAKLRPLSSKSESTGRGAGTILGWAEGGTKASVRVNRKL